MKPVDGALLARLAREQGTPVYVYDANVIRERIEALRGFDVIRYAQKAWSNLAVLRLMRQEGLRVDAVSAGEIQRGLRAGFSGAGEPASMVYTADIFTAEALDLVVEHDIPVNAGSTDMLEQLGRRKPGHRVWLRVNPGFGHGHSRKTNTGGIWSKHGIWYEYLEEALRSIEKHRLDLVGLHMHIGSGTDFEHLKEVCEAMVAQVSTLGVDVRSISGGGGLPIPYEAGQDLFDTESLHSLWNAARKQVEKIVAHEVSLEIEPGRFLVGESGKLLAEVRAIKREGPNRFVLVDAGFNNLVRPAMYGSRHEISFLKKSGEVASGETQPTIVAGPLCESGDVFTQDEGGIVVPRDLPDVEVGDYAVFHDTGAYSAVMAMNYNSHPFAPEILIDGSEVTLIRRRQTIDDLIGLEEV
ncbi:MAG: diaminopimelate decarboxylase [bacterium]|nr:diaminopimelate decarboxylase [bacterium]